MQPAQPQQRSADLPYKNRGDLTTGPVRDHLIRLTVPMIWGLFAVIFVQLTDTYFVSLLGTRELAGISFTFPVIMTMTHVIFGLNIAMSSVIARLIGERRMEDAQRITLHGLLIAFILSVILAFLCGWFLDPIFTTLGAGPESMEVIRAYMPLWLVASVIISVPTNGNSALRAAGDTLLPALIMTAIASINLALNPALIFGWFGLPALGVTGSALSTLIAYCCGMGISLYVLIFKKNLIRLDHFHFEKLKDSLRRLMVIAIPAGITNTIMPLTNAFITAILAVHGKEVVAAYGVTNRIEGLTMVFVLALALGMAPIVGQNWGARIFARVHEAINLSIRFNFIWAFLIALLLGIFAHPLAGLFSTDAIVTHYITLFFWIVPFSYAFGNLVFGWSSAFNAMGMHQRSFVMIVTKSILMTVPAVYIGHILGGPAGIFAALAFVNVTAGIGFHMLSWRACLAQEHVLQPAE